MWINKVTKVLPSVNRVDALTWIRVSSLITSFVNVYSNLEATDIVLTICYELSKRNISCGTFMISYYVHNAQQEVSTGNNFVSVSSTNDLLERVLVASSVSDCMELIKVHIFVKTSYQMVS